MNNELLSMFNTQIILHSNYANPLERVNHKLETNVFDKIETEKYFIVDLEGDSMQNANLHHKDVLLFE